jgi:hypothetical protein
VDVTVQLVARKVVRQLTLRNQPRNEAMSSLLISMTLSGASNGALGLKVSFSQVVAALLLMPDIYGALNCRRKTSALLNGGGFSGRLLASSSSVPYSCFLP